MILRDFGEFILEILEILENAETVENKGESAQFLEIPEKFREFRDASSERAPFVMTPFSGGHKVQGSVDPMLAAGLPFPVWLKPRI